VPAKAALFSHIKTSFEAAFPEINLEIIDLSDNYYDETSRHAVTNTDADVLELDSVFIDDFIAANRIQPLPATLQPESASFLPVASAAAQSSGSWYAMPHWVCTNFLIFHRGDPLGTIKNFRELEASINKPVTPSNSLLIDLKGRSTLGELYLNALLDNYGTFEKLRPFLEMNNLDSGSVEILKRSRALCDSELCRDRAYHDMLGFYPRQFAHLLGRALVGYSEQLYYVGNEELNGCRKDTKTAKQCLRLTDGAGKALPPDLADVDLLPMPLSETGSTSFAWVDSFAIDARCQRQCLLDAEAFIRHTASLNEVLAALTPGYGEAPRYLLPALAQPYRDTSLVAAAPLYPKFFSFVQNAIAVRSQALNAHLRDIGGELDKNRLPK